MASLASLSSGLPVLSTMPVLAVVVVLLVLTLYVAGDRLGVGGMAGSSRGGLLLSLLSSVKLAGMVSCEDELL